MFDGKTFEDTAIYKRLSSIKPKVTATKPDKTAEKSMTEGLARLLAHKIKIGGTENSLLTFNDFIKYDKDRTYCCNHIEKTADEIEDIYNNLRTQSDLYIYGLPGTGKTSLLRYCALRYCWLNQRNDLLILNFADAIRAMQANNFAEKDSLINRMKSRSILFIDDLGTEQHTEWTHAVLFQILDSRLFKFTSNGKPMRTWFSSNIAPADLGTVYNDRLVRRILGNAKTITF